MGERKTYSARAALSDIRIAHVHERLGHAISLEDYVAEVRLERLVHVRGQRRRARYEEPNAGADGARPLEWKVKQAHVHGRHAKEKGRPIRLEQLGGGRVIEPLDEPHVASRRQPRVYAVAESVHVKERKHGEIAIGVRDLPARRERASALVAKLPCA